MLFAEHVDRTPLDVYVSLVTDPKIVASIT